MPTKLNPYLNFRDNAREAMEFYQTVFGGKLDVSTFKEYQATEDPSEENKIMHAVLEADNGITFMAADTPNSMEYRQGTDMAISLSGDDDAELSGYFEKLSAGGTIKMPLKSHPGATSSACSRTSTELTGWSISQVKGRETDPSRRQAVGRTRRPAQQRGRRACRPVRSWQPPPPERYRIPGRSEARRSTTASKRGKPPTMTPPRSPAFAGCGARGRFGVPRAALREHRVRRCRGLTPSNTYFSAGPTLVRFVLLTSGFPSSAAASCCRSATPQPVAVPGHPAVHRRRPALGIPPMPNTAPASPPATAATVSVSPPRSMTSRITSAKSRPCRSAHTAWPSVGHTAPFDSVASAGVQSGASTAAHRSRCSSATSSSAEGSPPAGRRRPAPPASARGRSRSPRRPTGRRASAPRSAGRRPWWPRSRTGRTRSRRRRPHQRAVAGRVAGPAKCSAAATSHGRPEPRRARLVADVRGPASPRCEPVEEVGLVQAAALAATTPPAAPSGCRR